jgi:hypothetical protein
VGERLSGTEIATASEVTAKASLIVTASGEVTAKMSLIVAASDAIATVRQTAEVSTIVNATAQECTVVRVHRGSCETAAGMTAMLQASQTKGEIRVGLVTRHRSLRLDLKYPWRYHACFLLE